MTTAPENTAEIAVNHGPMHQFEIHKLLDFSLFGVDLSITNSVVMMFGVIGVIIGVLWFCVRGAKIIPTKSQVIIEGLYNMVSKLISSNIENKTKLKYFPLVLSLFLFVLMSNALGIVPYTFTVTSHISVTFALAFIVFATVVVIGMVRKGPIGFFAAFIPSGIPIALAPLMLIIEFFAYLARPCTLAIRLAANMMAGHTMLKVIATFVGSMGVMGILPIGFISILTGFEIFVACLQAYIFSILTCIYINEALSDAH